MCQLSCSFPCGNWVYSTRHTRVEFFWNKTWMNEWECVWKVLILHSFCKIEIIVDTGTERKICLIKSESFLLIFQHVWSKTSELVITGWNRFKLVLNECKLVLPGNLQIPKRFVKGPVPVSFSFFRLFMHLRVHNVMKQLAMTGFEPGFSCVKSECSFSR